MFPFRQYPIAALLGLVLLQGCAAQPQGTAQAGGWPAGMTAQPRPETVAAFRRLPARAGIWNRVRDLPGDGLVGLSTRYELQGKGAFATVFVNDHGNTPVTDGLGSAPVQELQVVMRGIARGNADQGVVEERVARTPGGPPQWCAVGRVTRDSVVTANYGCATGVAGQELRTRVTARYSAGDANEAAVVDAAVANLLFSITRAVAGLPQNQAFPPDHPRYLGLPTFDPRDRAS